MGILDKSRISPEQEVVLRSIRIDRAQDGRIQELLAGQLDWPSLRKFALQHGVLPLLYSRLIALGDNDVPSVTRGGEMQRLQELYRINARRNLRLTRMAVRVFDLLSEGGIQHMPIKGPTLALRLYGDTSLRHFSDLDILIRAEDFRPCYQILTEAGFTPKFPVSRKDESWLLRADTEHQFTYRGDVLEIHWAFAERGVQYPLNGAQLWNHLDSIEIHGREVRALSKENLLLVLCIHGTKHMWGRLTWIADLAYFIKAYPDLDWSVALDDAKRAGFHRVVCLGLLMAESIGGVQLPKEISYGIHADATAGQLAIEAGAKLIDETQTSEDGQVAYYLRTRERVRDRAYYVLDQAFIPKQIDWMTISLPAILYPLYYILRPMRLIVKFGPKIYQALLRN